MNFSRYIKANELFLSIHRKYVFTFLVFLSYASSYGQNTLFHKYDSLLLSYKGFEVIKEIDSLLDQKYFPFQDLKQVYFYKLKANIDIEDFDEAIIVANEIDNIKEIDTAYLIKFKIQKALLYEILEDSTKCFKNINELDKIYAHFSKENRDYAIFLYRKSSFYRVNGNKIEAKKFAEASYKFAEQKNYIDEIAVSSMLLSFLTDNEVESLKYMNISLGRWKETKDTHGATGMFLNLGNLYFKKGNYQTALLYADSAVAFISSYPISDLVSSSYKFRSKVLAKLGRYEDAYNDTKLYIESDDRMVQNKTLEKANLLSYKLAKKEHDKSLKEQKALNSSLKNKFSTFIIVFAFFILLLLILVFLFYRLKVYQKKLEKNTVKLLSLNKEKNILLKDFQHRTKNDFSLVLSLLELQLYSKKISLETKENLTTFKNRIQAIANAPHLVMDLYSRSNKNNNTNLNFEKYIKEIVFSLIQLSSKKNNVETDFINLTELNADTALPIGTIINELLTNSIKHARPASGEVLNVYIRLSQNGGEIKLIYCDNGRHFEENKSLDESIGLTIIESMVTQLRGVQLRISSNFFITLKVKNEQ